jgi:hypothetical protein
LKIHKIWAENIRGIKSKVEIEPALSGTTVFHAPNEFGKSTLAEALYLIFTMPHTSNDSYLKSMQRADSITGPTLGMIFELKDQKYSIEKTWLKNKNAVLKKLEPEMLEIQSGSESDKELKRLVEENFDEVLWRILQAPQNKSEVTFSSLVSSSNSSFLMDAFDIASSGEENEIDESFYAKVKSEYLEWYTESGRVKTEKDTQGRVLKERSDLHDELEKDIGVLESALQKADKIQNDSSFVLDNFEKLIEIQEFQQKIKRLDDISERVNKFNSTSSKLVQIKKEYPYVLTWNVEKSQTYNSLASSFEAYKNLPRLKITALKEIEIAFEGESISLNDSNLTEIPIIGGMELEIKGVANLAFPGEVDSNVLKENHDEFIRLGSELGVQNLQDARDKNSKFNDYFEKCNFIDNENKSGIANLIEEHSELVKLRNDNLIVWDLASEHEPVIQDDLLKIKKAEGEKIGRYAQIRESGIYDSYNAKKALLRSLENEIADFKLQRDAKKLLMTTIDNCKNRMTSNYSKIFESEINRLFIGLFPEGGKISVSENFEITSRNITGIKLELSQLSVGAKEQLSIMARVAMANLVSNLDSVPLILDDEFVNSDDHRLSQLMEILNRIENFQVLLFTCHPERYKKFKSLNLVDLVSI